MYLFSVNFKFSAICSLNKVVETVLNFKFCCVLWPR